MCVYIKEEATLLVIYIHIYYIYLACQKINLKEQKLSKSAEESISGKSNLDNFENQKKFYL